MFHRSISATVDHEQPWTLPTETINAQAKANEGKAPSAMAPVLNAGIKAVNMAVLQGLIYFFALLGPFPSFKISGEASFHALVCTTLDLMEERLFQESLCLLVALHRGGGIGDWRAIERRRNARGRGCLGDGSYEIKNGIPDFDI